MTLSINDLIIDTISKIRQPIETISKLETKEYPEFENLLDFLGGDFTFYDFPKAQVGGSIPLEPPKTNPPYANTLSPRPKFKFISNMASNIS